MRALGFNVTDDNEADALALLRWACTHGVPPSHASGLQRAEQTAAAHTPARCRVAAP